MEVRHVRVPRYCLVPDMQAIRSAEMVTWSGPADESIQMPAGVGGFTGSERMADGCLREYPPWVHLHFSDGRS